MTRWTDLAQWRGPSPHRYPGGMTGGGRSHGLVTHIASGYWDGTIAWQLDAYAGDPTSSHFVIARDGRIAQMLEIEDASWAQQAGNRTWHSAEFEGFALDDPQHGSHPGWERLTDAQIAAGGRLLARGHTELGWPLQLAGDPSGAGLGHHSMGAPGWGHASCPGDPIVGQKPAVLTYAQQITTGGHPTPPAGEGNDMPQDSGDLSPGFAVDEHNGWLDLSKAVAVPVPKTGPKTADGAWGPAWMYFAGAGTATVRYGCYPAGVWRDAHVDLTDATNPSGLPDGTTLVLIARKRTSAADPAGAVPVRWRIQYSS